MNISISALSQLFIITLIVILVYLLNNQKALELFMNKIRNNIEHFQPGVFGFQLGIPLNPYNCRPEDDCYKGSPMRSQIYQNVCEPNYGLLKQKIPLNDNCQRTIGGKMSAPRNYYVCKVNKHLQRKCGWIKK